MNKLANDIVKVIVMVMNNVRKLLRLTSLVAKVDVGRETSFIRLCIVLVIVVCTTHRPADVLTHHTMTDSAATRIPAVLNVFSTRHYTALLLTLVLSVCRLSVRHTRDPRPNGSRYRNAFRATR